MFGVIHKFSEFGKIDIDQRSQSFGRAQLFSQHKVICKDAIYVVISDAITKIYDGTQIPKEGQEEVIIELYKKHGPSFVKHCDGLFTILLFDLGKNKYFVLNNRYQTTTMYYYETKDLIVFAKDMQQIINNFLKNPQPHLGSIKSFVSNGFTIPDQTQIQGIKKMLPTYWLEVDLEKVHIKNHWESEFTFKRQSFESLDDHLDRYESIYQDGLKRHVEYHDTNNLGCLLSGGHDTSFAFIQASKVFNKKIHAFTATFPGWAWDEESYAKNICEKFNGKFHSVPFLPKDLDHLVGVVRANQEPVVSVSLPMYLIGKEAKNHVDTMLGGDGGDTLWGEYYPVAEFHRYIKHMPVEMRRLVNKAATGLRKLTDWERFWELEHVSSLFTEDDYYNDFMRKLCTYRHFSYDYQNELFSTMFEGVTPAESSLEIKFTPDNFREALIEGKLFNAFYTYQSFFTYRAMEKFDLSLYFPTINKELMDLITTLPYSWVNGGTTLHRLTNHKAINRRFHKRALARYLRSEEIYNRSFDIPWYNILKPRKEVLKRLLERLKRRGWYQEKTLDILFNEFQNQKVKEHELLELKHHGYRVYTLLNLEVWCMEYLDGNINKPQDESIPLEDYLAMAL